MSTLRPDPVALAESVLASDHMRRRVLGLSVNDVIAMAARLWELDLAAKATGRYLAAQSADRAAVLFASPTVTAAHDTLAEALVELGYVTMKDENHVE